MNRKKLDDIIALVSRILNPGGFECIEADWLVHDRILRLYVDRLSDGPGIDLDGCVTASKLLEESAELDEAINGKYVLEVSSPGIERPLRRPSDFERQIGRTVQVRLAEKFHDRRQGVGRLVGVTGATGDDAAQAMITLETEQGEWSFPWTCLQRASIVHDWTSG